jgi:hypothetical protein
VTASVTPKKEASFSSEIYPTPWHTTLSCSRYENNKSHSKMLTCKWFSLSSPSSVWTLLSLLFARIFCFAAKGFYVDYCCVVCVYVTAYLFVCLRILFFYLFMAFRLLGQKSNYTNNIYILWTNFYFILSIRTADQVSIMTRLWGGWLLGRWRDILHHCARNSYGATQPPSRYAVVVISLGIMWPGCEATNLHLAQSKDYVELYFHSPTRVCNFIWN